jgi:ATP-dependent DNA ligase
MTLPLPLSMELMEAETAGTIPAGPAWQLRAEMGRVPLPGFPRRASRALRSKSGQDLNRYFPDTMPALSVTPVERFVLDGELVIAIDGAPSFEELQMPLHPAASRVSKLAAAHPARLIVFDLLADEGGQDLTGQVLAARRAALENLMIRLRSPALALCPATCDVQEARRWLAALDPGRDGVMAKRLDAPYAAGRRDAMVKVKYLRSADCVVGGFRYLQAAPEVGSLLLGLYDDAGRLDHVGFTATIPRAERPALTRHLQAIIALPGFTGRAPGGPSRWSNGRSADWQPVRPEIVVEVRYDHVTGDRFRHGTTLLRFRPDKKPAQCRIEQIRAAR